MEIRKPKTLEDFPKFIVTAVRRGSTSETGYTRFEIDGSFGRIIEKIDPRWFWLLFGEGLSLCASLKSLDEETEAAILTCDVKDEPKIVGQAGAYLSPSWQAYHVWMILEEGARWEEVLFHATDAIRVSSTAGDGKEIHGLKRMPQGDLPAGAQVVTDGWDHEHCELCNKHIDP